MRSLSSCDCGFHVCNHLDSKFVKTAVYTVLRGVSLSAFCLEILVMHTQFIHYMQANE